MFAVTVPEDFPSRINLKCDPQRAVEHSYQLVVASLPGKIRAGLEKQPSSRRKK
jgi:predicted DNA-binding protein (MmcQ/YjbR family)